MRLEVAGQPHLTYCTNIHPGETLAEVTRHLETHVAKVKSRVCESRPFGVGLRLSGRASLDLQAPGALEQLSATLASGGLYAFTINGFPYGTFHGKPVKESVYLPDWLDDERLGYTDRLAWQLARLLPDGVDGSISTVPGAFHSRIRSDVDEAAVAERLLRHVATLFEVYEATGKRIELALEPEPRCYLETTAEAVGFFERALLSRRGLDRLISLSGLGQSTAEQVLRRHLGVCLDACHAAVQFESPREALGLLEQSGIRVGKIQVTAGLRLELSGRASEDAARLDALERFADDVYLHQVVERRGGKLRRWVDLPEALATRRERPDWGPAEWRVHFHVPIFCDRLDPFDSTQPFVRELLASAARRPVTPHLEVETYTWDVLPPEHRQLPVDEAIARELVWARKVLESEGE